MTSPRWAVDTERGRYYHLPSGEKLPSVTNILQTSVSKAAIPWWAARITAEKAWEMLPRLVAGSLRSDAYREALTKEMKSEHDRRKTAAGDLGQRVHHEVEARVLGKPFPEDPELEPFVHQALEAFKAFRIDWEADVEATEATVVNRTWGYAGTGDVWLWLRSIQFFGDTERHLGYIDYKTNGVILPDGEVRARPATSVFPENGLQCAAIARGEVLLLDDGTEHPPPGPVEWCGILSLRPTEWKLMRMPIVGTIDDAFDAFVRLIPSTRHIHACDDATPTAIQPPTLRPTREAAMPPPPENDAQMMDAIAESLEVLNGTGRHADHEREQEGRCVFCSCGRRVQGRMSTTQPEPVT